jgi:hypothetical protein
VDTVPHNRRGEWQHTVERRCKVSTGLGAGTRAPDPPGSGSRRPPAPGRLDGRHDAQTPERRHDSPPFRAPRLRLRPGLASSPGQVVGTAPVARPRVVALDGGRQPLGGGCRAVVGRHAGSGHGARRSEASSSVPQRIRRRGRAIPLGSSRVSGRNSPQTLAGTRPESTQGWQQAPNSLAGCPNRP